MKNQPQKPILCSYTNEENKWQIVRISGSHFYDFERTLYPGMSCQFMSEKDLFLEIIRPDGGITSMVDERVICSELTAKNRIFKKGMLANFKSYRSISKKLQVRNLLILNISYTVNITLTISSKLN